MTRTRPPARFSAASPASRLCAAVLVGAGCAPWYYEVATEYARSHPETAYALEASLTQGCPWVGGPAKPLRHRWGKPVTRAQENSGAEEWSYRLKQGVELRVTVERDTITDWIVIGRPTERHARRHFSWSMNQARGFPARVTSYLAGEPGTDSRQAFLLYRACPQPGIPARALRASWGEPSRADIRADTTFLIYGFGVEGQHEVIALVSDTVRRYWAVDPMAEAWGR